MTKQDMIDTLLLGLEKANDKGANTVTISAGAASEILSLLIQTRENPQPRISKKGEVMFYCAICSQSFMAVPREDPECFAKWHYHRWFANCPKCNPEVVQNDRYWR